MIVNNIFYSQSFYHEGFSSSFSYYNHESFPLQQDKLALLKFPFIISLLQLSFLQLNLKSFFFFLIFW